MAHITKFKASAMGQIFAHINRERTPGTYGNKEINESKSDQNFALVQGDIETLQKRLDEVSHQKRDDLIVCCSVVITLPQELKDEKYAKKCEFFKNCNEFLTQKFGADNCIYSVVHFDETTPHLHYGFVPVIEKERKYKSKEKAGQTYTQKRVCADDVITRKMLNTFHDELQAHIAKKFPDVRVVSEEKEQRLKQNKSIAELKQKEIELLTTLSKKEKKNKKNIFGIVKNDEIIISAEQYEILQRKTEDLLDIKSGKMFEENQRLKAENADLKRYAADTTTSKAKELEEMRQKAQKAINEARAEADRQIKQAQAEETLEVAKTLINKLMRFADAYHPKASMDTRIKISQTYLECVENGFIDHDQYVNEKPKRAEIQKTNTKSQSQGVTRG